MRDEDTPLSTEDTAAPDAVSRRDFLKLGAMTAALPAVVGPTVVQVAGQEVAIHGPGKTPVTLTVNGRRYTAQLEPRVTLLDALRDNFDLTGAKKVCDRAECGACTVLLDGKSVYACSMLAIDAQGHQITTVEGLTQGETLNNVQQAFVANDAQQCGFCTPGFIVAGKALLDRTPNPTHEQVVKGLAGNFCRCGTYFGMRGAMAALGQKPPQHAQDRRVAGAPVKGGA